jgi:hypothetical protein
MYVGMVHNGYCAGGVNFLESPNCPGSYGRKRRKH